MTADAITGQHERRGAACRPDDTVAWPRAVQAWRQWHTRCEPPVSEARRQRHRCQATHHSVAWAPLDWQPQEPCSPWEEQRCRCRWWWWWRAWFTHSHQGNQGGVAKQPHLANVAGQVHDAGQERQLAACGVHWHCDGDSNPHGSSGGQAVGLTVVAARFTITPSLSRQDVGVTHAQRKVCWWVVRGCVPVAVAVWARGYVCWCVRVDVANAVAVAMCVAM